MDTFTQRASVFAYPQAVSSAQELLKGGDYLKLLAYDQSFYTGPLKRPRPVPDHPEYSEDQLRRYYLERAGRLLDRAVAIAEQGMPANQKDYCDALTNKDNFFAELNSAGVPVNLNYHLNYRDESVFFHLSYGVCALQSEFTPALLADLKVLRQDFPNLVAKILAQKPQDYVDRTVQGIRAFDAGPWQRGSSHALAPFMWSDLTNSSTNLERKRGAYILKHYFCDDLTPISVVIPSDHAQGRHASEPSCYSCHYKLDPMAGFFRTIGAVGIDFASGPRIRFEDTMMMAVDEYVANWKANPASGRAWDVGYVRSSTFPQFNSYGESMPDLFKIIGEAPEAKKCIVKRMHQFFVGENQAVDAGYLDYLSNRFIEESHVDSSKAFKDTLYAIVESKAFVAADPRRGECYDYAPGTDPANKPPCKVSFLLQKNCVSCHGGATPEAGLDLSAWIRLSDGTFSFPHKDAHGTQRSRAETFKMIDERVTTGDANRRMPFDRYIDGDDQLQIVSWVETQLKRKGRR